MKIKYIVDFQDDYDDLLLERSVKQKFASTLIDETRFPKRGDIVNLLLLGKCVDLSAQESKWLSRVAYIQNVKAVLLKADFAEVELSLEV